jgi:hypothetical protein
MEKKKNLIITVSHPSRVRCLLEYLYNWHYAYVSDKVDLNNGSVISFDVDTDETNNNKYNVSPLEIIWEGGLIADLAMRHKRLKRLDEAKKNKEVASFESKMMLIEGRYVIIVQDPEKKKEGIDIFESAGKKLGDYIWNNKESVKICAPCFSSDIQHSHNVLSTVLNNVSRALEDRMHHKQTQMPKERRRNERKCAYTLRTATIVVLPCNHEVRLGECTAARPVKPAFLYPPNPRLHEHRIDYTFYNSYYKKNLENKSLLQFTKPKACGRDNNLLEMIRKYVQFAELDSAAAAAAATNDDDDDDDDDDDGYDNMKERLDKLKHGQTNAEAHREINSLQNRLDELKLGDTIAANSDLAAPAFRIGPHFAAAAAAAAPATAAAAAAPATAAELEELRQLEAAMVQKQIDEAAMVQKQIDDLPAVPGGVKTSGGGVPMAPRRRRKRKTARTRHPIRKRRRSNKYHNNRKTGRTRTRRGRR